MEENNQNTNTPPVQNSTPEQSTPTPSLQAYQSPKTKFRHKSLKIVFISLIVLIFLLIVFYIFANALGIGITSKNVRSIHFDNCSPGKLGPC